MEQTSSVSLHLTKHKGASSDINGLQRHNERKPNDKVKHSNKKIDSSKTGQNIFLIEDNRTYKKRIDDTIEKNRTVGTNRKVRKDAVRLVEGTVQISGKISEQPLDKQVEYLKQSFEFLKVKFGQENFIGAVIHLDETTPHLHFEFVPIRDGRLNSKEINSRSEYRRYQREFLEFSQGVFPAANFVRKADDQRRGLPQDVFEQVTAEEKKLKEREEAAERLRKAANKRTEEVNAARAKLQPAAETIKSRVRIIEKKEAELTAREAKAAEREAGANERLQEATKQASRAEQWFKLISEKLKTFADYIKKGRLKPETVAETVDKYTPITSENVAEANTAFDELLERAGEPRSGKPKPKVKKLNSGLLKKIEKPEARKPAEEPKTASKAPERPLEAPEAPKPQRKPKTAPIASDVPPIDTELDFDGLQPEGPTLGR